MCGIAGVVEKDITRKVDSLQLKIITDFLVHRGPDGEGIYTNDHVGFGHRRLSIIDIKGGAQPMVSSCGRYIICFNGELYNYLELKEQLTSKGHQFKTQSDTEVLLHALMEHGPRILPKLNGMFAFSFYDRHTKEVLLVRDHVGIKPLYYYDDDDRVMFASDVGALSTHRQFKKEIEPKAISHFLTYRVVPAPYTIFKNTFTLMPGHYLKIDAKGKLQNIKYWDIPVHERTSQTSPLLLAEEFEGLLSDAIRLQVRSDVPVGAFLSGGVDSSTVAYWMKQAAPNSTTFTLGFTEEDKRFDESNWAQDTAKHIGISNHTDIARNLSIEPYLEDAVYYFGQPCGTGLPNFLISKFARQHVKVALAGVGGDELFAGYGRFKLKSTRDFIKSLSNCREDEKAQLFSNEFFSEVKHEPSVSFIEQQMAHVKTDELINKLCYVDMRHFMLNDLLFNLDKMSMAHSLEVRVPLLDYRIVEFAMKVPPALKMREGIQKLLLKRAMYDKLPRHVFLRSKKGFSLPKEHWVLKLAPQIKDILLDKKADERGWFNNVAKKQYVDSVLAHEKISWRDANTLWNMFNLELWARTFLDSTPVSRKIAA